MNNTPLHTFHIPVLGLAYTIDSPIKVARYGINSVISIIEDKLIELMRMHYYKEVNKPCIPITPKEHDYRARRITDYLNLMNDIVKEQVEKLVSTAFKAGSEISKYFDMLPDEHSLRLLYIEMMRSNDSSRKSLLADYLRKQVRAGRIDVNIMTKVDKNNYDADGAILTDSSDALAALRGYANSDLTNSAVIFSAGLNPRLFNYLETLQAFHPKGWGIFDKSVVVKVSDFRSALIQGKYLAKKGIWVSEFRIESGLNCGGHAFATDGSLLGPILEEFRIRRNELKDSLHALYNPVMQQKGLATFPEPHPLKITVQGGIGTSEEANLLLSYYDVASTGWGTPFLLCPEATTVDDSTLHQLCAARENDILLSKNSPLGIRFNYLKGTSSETERLARIRAGKPGSPCTEKHLVSNTEFTDKPICTASHIYQKMKIAQLQTLNLPADAYEKQYSDIVSKECLCVGLSNAVTTHYKLPPFKQMRGITMCPGPNVAYFNKVVSLKEMVDYIYGRCNIVDGERPHMFIKELSLNIAYLREQLQQLTSANEKTIRVLRAFGDNLLAGIAYYRKRSSDFIKQRADIFNEALNRCEAEVESLVAYKLPA
jgi:hypothetical protein